MSAPGWHPAMNVSRDQIGTAHVLREDGKPLCGSRPWVVCGGGFGNARQGGCHECRRCRAILDTQVRKTRR